MNPNVAARLAERAERHPERRAIVQGSGRRASRVTFGELAERVDALAARLRARGIAPGDRVLIFVPMSADLYVSLLACFQVGAVAAFVDAWAGRARLDAAVRAAAPRAFLGTPRAQLLRLGSRELRRVALHWLPGRGVLGVERWGAPGASAPAERLAEDAPALVTWTTGSTGRPRAAVRSHGFLWAQHRVLAAHLGLHEHDLDMPTLPFFVLNNLACGVPSVIPDADPRRTAAFRPAAVFRQMEEHGVTTASGSPAFWERLARWCGSSGNRLPLRALWTGGAPVLPPLARLLQRSVAGTAHVVYGSTEAEPISGIPVPQMLALLDGAEAAEGGVCVGAPVAGIRLRIVRPHEGPIRLGAAGWAEWETEPGDTGEVMVAGTHVLGGYLHDPDAERALKIRDGACVWHRTGDAARLDAAGRLWLMGRVAERVRRDGRNWWSGAVEARAVEVEGVAHAAYLRMPGEGRRDRAVLCVEAGSMPPDSGLEQRLRAAIAPAPVDELRILRCIPRDPRHASKTDAAALRRLLG